MSDYDQRAKEKVLRRHQKKPFANRSHAEAWLVMSRKNARLDTLKRPAVKLECSDEVPREGSDVPVSRNTDAERMEDELARESLVRYVRGNRKLMARPDIQSALEVFRLLQQGLDLKQIASELATTTRTLRNRIELLWSCLPESERGHHDH